MKKSKSSPMKKKTAAAKKPGVVKKVLAKPKRMAQEKSNTESAPVEGRHHGIVQMILDDHKPLKRCIGILKNSELSLSSRRAAFNEFAPLLTIHAKAEEAVLYTYEKTEVDMRENAFEGDVEHALADQLVEEVKQSVDKDIWSAKAKVLAELVEHHIKEEETEMFPELKKEADVSDLIRLGEEYQIKKDEIKVGILHPTVQKQHPVMSIRH
tara:strand:+ start:18790 stop:19422 length:633 start_codon:yes stop_codon:yes gene_type:complete